MADKGWIKLHRQLQESPFWYGSKFTKGQAWVDLLLSANHSEKKILFNGEMVEIKRGQYLTSMVKLAEKWQWNRKTVSAFLSVLQKEGMIIKVSDNTKTLITIENYEVYQCSDETDGQPIGQLSGQLNGQPIGQPMDSITDTNKNVKNDKNIYNNIYSRVEDDFSEKRKAIVEYLNTVCKTAYRHNSKNTVKHINARLKEGYTEDDFKSVIDKKAKEWLGTNMEQYLRPETLFGTKFEGYLNQKITTEKEENYESESSVRLW